MPPGVSEDAVVKIHGLCQMGKSPIQIALNPSIEPYGLKLEQIQQIVNQLNGPTSSAIPQQQSRAPAPAPPLPPPPPSVQQMPIYHPPQDFQSRAAPVVFQQETLPHGVRVDQAKQIQSLHSMGKKPSQMLLHHTLMDSGLTEAQISAVIEQINPSPGSKTLHTPHAAAAPAGNGTQGVSTPTKVGSPPLPVHQISLANAPQQLRDRVMFFHKEGKSVKEIVHHPSVSDLAVTEHLVTAIIEEELRKARASVAFPPHPATPVSPALGWSPKAGAVSPARPVYPSPSRSPVAPAPAPVVHSGPLPAGVTPDMANTIVGLAQRGKTLKQIALYHSLMEFNLTDDTIRAVLDPSLVRPTSTPVQEPRRQVQDSPPQVVAKKPEPKAKEPKHPEELDEEQLNDLQNHWENLLRSQPSSASGSVMSVQRPVASVSSVVSVQRPASKPAAAPAPSQSSGDSVFVF